MMMMIKLLLSSAFEDMLLNPKKTESDSYKGKFLPLSSCNKISLFMIEICIKIKCHYYHSVIYSLYEYTGIMPLNVRNNYLIKIAILNYYKKSILLFLYLYRSIYLM